MSKEYVFHCDFPGCCHTYHCESKRHTSAHNELAEKGWFRSKGGNTHYCPEHTPEMQEKKGVNLEVWTVDQYEAARMLKVPPSYLQHQRFLGLPPTYVRIGNKVRYRVKDLQEYLQANTVHPAHL